MAVKLRLARHGAKGRPYYRLVAADERQSRDGRFLEHVGSYDPNKKPAGVYLKRERVQYWLSVGAQPTQTVKNLLNRYLDGEDTMSVTPSKKERKPIELPDVTPLEEQKKAEAEAKAAEEAAAAPAEAGGEAAAEGEAPAAEAPAAEAPAAEAAADGEAS